ncbi:hypothetical protein [Providencia stuartii]
MSDFITLIKDNKEAVGFIVAVSGGIGFFLNYFLARKKIKEDKKALRQQMITNNIAPMRQAWINDVRSKVSEFIHDSLTLRVEVLAYILHAQKNKPIQITPESREYILFSKINFGSRYLDVLLPFNLPEEDRNEEIAESLRKNIIDIRWNFDEIFSSFDNCIYDNLEPYLNKVLSLSDEAIENSKKLLLQEWRVTKSLSEIDDK